MFLKGNSSFISPGFVKNAFYNIDASTNTMSAVAPRFATSTAEPSIDATATLTTPTYTPPTPTVPVLTPTIPTVSTATPSATTTTSVIPKLTAPLDTSGLGTSSSPNSVAPSTPATNSPKGSGSNIIPIVGFGLLVIGVLYGGYKLLKR